MKRLLLGAAIAALSSQAFGQVQADHTRNCYISAMEEDMTGAVCDKPLIVDEDVIVLGTRIGTSDLSTLTSAASVMTGVDIRERGQQYISELLRSLPGIAVNTSGPGGGLTQIRLRGAEANHVLVLIDGVDWPIPMQANLISLACAPKMSSASKFCAANNPRFTDLTPLAA